MNTGLVHGDRISAVELSDIGPVFLQTVMIGICRKQKAFSSIRPQRTRGVSTRFADPVDSTTTRIPDGGDGVRAEGTKWKHAGDESSDIDELTRKEMKNRW